MVPLYLEHLGITPFMIGVILASHAFVAAVGALLAPRFILSMPFRTVLGVGIMLLTVGCLIFSVFTFVPLLVLGQMIGGLSSILIVIATQSFVGQVSPRPQLARNFSLLVSTFGVAGIIGPTLAGTLERVLSYQWAFLIMAIVSLVAFGASRLVGEEKVQGAGEAADLNWRSMKMLLEARGFQVGLIVTVAAISILSLSMSFYPLYLASIGLSTQIIGALLSIRSLGELIAPVTIQWIEARMGRLRLLLMALGMGVVLLVLIPSLVNLSGLALTALLLGVTFGYIVPISLALVSENAGAEQRPLAMAVRFAVNRGTDSVGPLLFGTAVQLWSYAAAFYACATYLLWTAYYAVKNRVLVEHHLDDEGEPRASSS